jgi:hypothetical protein
MAPIGNVRLSSQKRRTVRRGPAVGMRAPRPAYDNHQRAEMVACMLLPTPATLQQTADEVARKGSRLHGLYRRPSTRTISRVRRRFRLTGNSDAKVGHGGPGISLSAPQIKSLRRWCRAPDGQKRGTRLRFARDWSTAALIRLQCPVPLAVGASNGPGCACSRRKNVRRCTDASKRHSA